MENESKNCAPDLDSVYKMIREQIQHEDNLVNQRLTWLLGIEAFLFAAFAALITSSTPSQLQRKLPFCITLFGMAFALISIFSIDAAFRSLERLLRFWNEHPNHHLTETLGLITSAAKYESLSGYPPITYVGGKIARAGSAAYGTPALIVFAWIVLGTLFVTTGFWKDPATNLSPAPATAPSPSYNFTIGARQSPAIADPSQSGREFVDSTTKAPR